MAIESGCASLVCKIAELLVEPVKKQFRYMFCSNNFVQEFNEQVWSLVLALYHMQVAVNNAKRNGEVIDIYVNTWLEEAKKALALGLQDAVNIATKNVEEIENYVNKWCEVAKKALALYVLQGAVDVATKNAEEIEIDVNKWLEGVIPLENEKCFTWCPKWIHQFKLSKALEKETETLRKLEEKSKKFPKVAHKPPLQDIEIFQSEEFTSSKSSNEALEQIMKALKDDNVNMIGLYGMGGVGKTYLVKEVGRRATELHLFDEVLLATVSQNPNVMYIQDRMAESLGLKFDVKTIEGRAGRLRQRMKTEKKLLVILDDVWKDVNLKEIGIPVGDAHRGCKVLLTTRLQDICSYMKCQQKVYLDILSENEAWALFKINAGLSDEDSNLNTVAKKVARECQGLPIALVTVGRALSGKVVIEWEEASRKLKNSQLQHMKQIGEQNKTYACIRLSYDYLNHEETRSCFLLCCLFPEDYDILIEDLTRYAVGYGLYQDVESIEEARKQVYVAIKTLKDCCMLLGTKTEKHVKMHDLVRDVAIQIASSKEHGFMVKAGIGLKEWRMNNKSIEGCTTISLKGNKLAELPEGLVCPQLKVLLLELDNDLNVPERFFEGMKEIEVLSLEGGCLSLQSLEFSTNLQSLLLIGCKCNDLIWLRKLQRLKILSLISYTLKELPDEIGELKELRLLDVTSCYSLRIPVNLIGRLKKLEELLIGGDSFKGWGVVGGDSTRGMNASITELNLLSHLVVLSLRIPRVECIPRDFVFPRLIKFDIVLGNGYSKIEYPTSTRLYLRDISAASLNANTFEQLFPAMSQIRFRNIEGLENIALFGDQMISHSHRSQKDFLQRLEDVEVYGCRDIRTLFPAKWRQVLNNLTSVVIQDCESLEEVFELGESGEGINKEELRLLSSLTRLELKWLPELKCIWKGPTRHASLRSFVHLELVFLEKLTFIFTMHLAQSLVHLETIRIENCSGLKHLIREKDDEREIIPESLGFPKLKTLSIRGCDKLEYVFPVSVSPSVLNLEVMKIVFGANLKQIFYSREGDALTRDGIINFPRLRELSLSRPKNFTAQLPSLLVLYIIGHEGKSDLLAQLQGLTNLREIYITSCKGAQHLMQAGSFVPNRRTGHEWWQDLKNLVTMEIEHCESLEEVFELDEVDEGSGEVKELRLLSSLTSLVLRRLPELKCIWKGPTRHVSLRSLVHMELVFLDKLTFIFTPHLAQSLVHLETIRIENCSGLKHLIREKDDEREIIPDSLGFPKLKTLSIRGCDKLEYVFPVSVSPSLLNLEEMDIKFGPNLRQIFYSGEGDALPRDGIINFPRLGELSLSSGCSFFGPKNFTAQFPSLQVLSIGGHEELGDLLAHLQGLTNLRKIYITSCKGAQHLMQAGSFVPNRRTGNEWWQDLKNLVTMEIEHCESLEEVFELDEVDEGSGEVKEMRLLSSLTSLVLQRLPELKCIWKGPTRHVSLRSLVHVELVFLDKLTFIFTPHLAQSLVHLETIRIQNCSGLKHLIREKDDEREIIPDSLGFPKLKTLSIRGCDKLEYVFPVSVSPSLLNLEEMDIKFGPNLKQIFYSGEGDALPRDGIINFPRLGELSLPRGCSFFGPKNFTAQLPSLQVLSIGGHEELGDLLAHLQGLTNLRKIYITSCKGAQHLMQAGSFVPNRRTGHEWWQVLKNLVTMEIEHCESLEEVFELDEVDEGSGEVKELRLLSSLTSLVLRRLPELKCIWKGPTRHVSLRSLVHLKLQYLNKLTFIFTPHLAQSLVHLETLEIDDCSGLKHLIEEKDDDREIIPESLGFPKLKTLCISGCYELEDVFPVSVSPSLLNLEEITIFYCCNLKQIFYGGEGDAHTSDDVINFPRLRELSLSSCSFFGPKNFTAQLPSLQVLAIKGHEELGDLLAQLQGHTNLREIRITDCKGAQDRRTGHKLSLLSLETLILSSLPDMRCIWKGLVASHLTTLGVYYCEKLKHVFTGSMVASLVQLQSLYISYCEELEQIIAKDQILSGSDLQSLCFPNLCTVGIRGCNKLRSLFPVAMASGLPKLERLEVAYSSQLLGVFGQDDDASPVNVEKQMVLPNLSSLWLYNLPSIVCFSLGCDDFLFPRLEFAMVDKCPKLTTQFARKTNGSTSAQSEVSQSS